MQNTTFLQYNAILLDVQMPPMDGLKTAEYIRRCENDCPLHLDGEVYADLLVKLASGLQVSHIPIVQ